MEKTELRETKVIYCDMCDQESTNYFTIPDSHNGKVHVCKRKNENGHRDCIATYYRRNT